MLLKWCIYATHPNCSMCFLLGMYASMYTKHEVVPSVVILVNRQLPRMPLFKCANAYCIVDDDMAIRKAQLLKIFSCTKKASLVAGLDKPVNALYVLFTPSFPDQLLCIISFLYIVYC